MRRRLHLAELLMLGALGAVTATAGLLALPYATGTEIDMNSGRLRDFTRVGNLTLNKQPSSAAYYAYLTNESRTATNWMVAGYRQRTLSKRGLVWESKVGPAFGCDIYLEKQFAICEDGKSRQDGLRNSPVVQMMKANTFQDLNQWAKPRPKFVALSLADKQRLLQNNLLAMQLGPKNIERLYMYYEAAAYIEDLDQTTSSTQDLSQAINACSAADIKQRRKRIAQQHSWLGQ